MKWQKLLSARTVLSTIDLMLSALFIGGHILLEGVPGIAKTLNRKNAGENNFCRLFAAFSLRQI
jgi:hypothetical protein